MGMGIEKTLEGKKLKKEKKNEEVQQRKEIDREKEKLVKKE